MVGGSDAIDLWAPRFQNVPGDVFLSRCSQLVLATDANAPSSFLWGTNL